MPRPRRCTPIAGMTTTHLLSYFGYGEGVWVVGCAANGITSAFAWLLQNSRKLSINMRGPTRKMNETGKFFAISHWLIFMCSTAHTIQCPVPSNVQFCAPHNGSIIIINYHFVGIASAASQKNRAITTETTTISIAGISSSISPHPFFWSTPTSSSVSLPHRYSARTFEWPNTILV